jgi:uncharacterized protein (TIGR03435 family)
MVAAVGLHAQSTAQPSGLRFEVASLKPSPLGLAITGFRLEPGGERYTGRNVTLKRMIWTAYHIRTNEIAGGPDWMDRDPFDLDAKAERPSTADEFREMLRNLLAERFHLQFRKEKKDLPVYLLTVDNSGPKLTPHDAQIGDDTRLERSPGLPLHIKVNAVSASMARFAWYMGSYLDRPMLDQTGLRGDYDFSLAYTMEPPATMQEGMLGHDGKPIDFSGPTIYQALRQQMGLRLEAGKGSVETMLIDHAERPVGK